MSKDFDGNKAPTDANHDDIQPPPPSYANSAAINSQFGGNTSFAPPAGQPPSNTFYQAQPVGGQAYPPPVGGYPPPSGFVQPSGQPSTIVYIVDDNRNNGGLTGANDGGMMGTGDRSPGGIPVAMICFIFGLSLHMDWLSIWDVLC
ncbi:hypothetical protein BGZ94_002489 [Podila epigama]|nr:hypothetical protein BGZ94_002489 [Podila epigama]